MVGLPRAPGAGRQSLFSPYPHPDPRGSSSACARRRLVCEADREARQEAGREPCCQHPGGRQENQPRDQRPALHESLGAPTSCLRSQAQQGLGQGLYGALWGSTLKSENMPHRRGPC